MDDDFETVNCALHIQYMNNYLFKYHHEKGTKMKIPVFTLCLLLFPFIVTSQDITTLEDYNRAVDFLYENYNNKKAFNLHVQPHLFPDSTGLWYVHHSTDNKRYQKITLPGLIKSDLFDHQELAQILSDSLESEVNANDIPISEIEYVSEHVLIIKVKGHTYSFNTVKKMTQQMEKRNSPQTAHGLLSQKIIICS